MNFSERQIIFWLSVTALIGLMLYLLGDVIAPFVAGFALAYILDPLVDRLERIYIPRLAGAFLAILLAAGSVIGLFLLILPILLSQLSSIIENFPAYVDWFRATLLEIAPQLKELLNDAPSLLSQTKSLLPSELFQNLFTSLRTGGEAIASFLSFLIITPIVSIYLLRDWDKIINYIDSLLPPRKAEAVREMAKEIDGALSATLRGLVFVCSTLAVFYGVSLHLLGLDFGLLIGIFSGLISFIPYAGAIFGFILALQAGLFQFWPDWQWALLICGGVFGVGQILEGYVLTPRLVGDRVGVDVVWLIFALMAFGALWGFTGLLIALPASAVIAILMRHGIKRYQASDYYKK